MRTDLWLYLAVPAALRGDSGVDAQVARYEQLIQQLGSDEPPTPPPVDG